MKFRNYSLFILFLFISACSQIVPEPTSTPIPMEEWPGMWFREYSNYIPTDTPSNEPYKTRTPVPTPNPTQEVLQYEFLEDVKYFLEEYAESSGNYVESISFVRIDPSTGYLEIKLVASATVFEIQPFISFRLLQSISQLFVSADFREEFKAFTNADDFFIDLTTVANERGRYEYNSVTRWELMENLSTESISMKEWMSESNAGFVP